MDMMKFLHFFSLPLLREAGRVMAPAGEEYSTGRRPWQGKNFPVKTRQKRLTGIKTCLILQFKEALMKSTHADLRQKFLLARKKTAGILTDFKIF
nr:hypothetical protein [uncultured Oscillibacter sp.]